MHSAKSCNLCVGSNFGSTLTVIGTTQSPKAQPFIFSILFCGNYYINCINLADLWSTLIESN